jgi:hypothetical protein
MLRSLSICFLLLLTTSAQSQKLVDPSKVAPEYREAAEKRRAEQIRQQTCAKKADSEKVMPRERTTFHINCLEVELAKQAEATKQ